MIRLELGNKELRFEHSLVSLSDWEAHYEKPFFSPKQDEEKSEEEMFKYFEHMLISNPKNRHLIPLIDSDQMFAMANYINAGRTATIVREIPGKNGPNENVTSELIYYWMISFKIPFKPSDEWHLNRLLTLVRVCGVKSQPPGKQSKSKIAQDYRKINEERRRQTGSSG